MAMGDCRGGGGGLEGLLVAIKDCNDELGRSGGLLSVMKVWGGGCGGSEDLLEMEDSRGEGGESEGLLVVRGD